MSTPLENKALIKRQANGIIQGNPWLPIPIIPCISLLKHPDDFVDEDVAVNFLWITKEFVQNSLSVSVGQGRY